jgi:hypothetical protein
MKKGQKSGLNVWTNPNGKIQILSSNGLIKGLPRVKLEPWQV